MLTVNLYNNSSRGVVQNNMDTVTQGLQTPFRMVSNQFRLITPIGKQLVTVYSQIQFDEGPHRLSIAPGPFAQALNSGEPYVLLQQKFSQKHFNTHHFAEVTKGKKHWTFNPRVGFTTTLQQTDTDAKTPKSSDISTTKNDMHASYLKPYAKATLIYKKNQFDANFTLPVSAHFFHLQNRINDTTQKEQFVTFDPMVYANYKMNAAWRINAMAAYQNSFQNFNQILTGLVVDNYRSIRINNLPIAQSRNFAGSFGLFYRDPLKSIFTHAQYQYSNGRQPYLLANQINADGSREMIVLSKRNTVETHSLQMKLSKYVSSIKSTFTTGVDLNYMTGNQILAGEITQSINRSVTPNGKISSRFGTVFAMDYQISSTWADNQLKKQERNDFQFLSQSLQCHIYPAKNQYIGLMGEHYFNKAQNQKTNIFYPDIIYRYSFPKKKIDLQLSVMNLLDEDNFVTTQFNDFYFYQSIFQIRPRQVLVSVKFQW
jgi:hypothetical protein